LPNLRDYWLTLRRLLPSAGAHLNFQIMPNLRLSRAFLSTFRKSERWHPDRCGPTSAVTTESAPQRPRLSPYASLRVQKRILSGIVTLFSPGGGIGKLAVLFDRECKLLIDEWRIDERLPETAEDFRRLRAYCDSEIQTSDTSLTHGRQLQGLAKPSSGFSELLPDPTTLVQSQISALELRSLEDAEAPNRDEMPDPLNVSVRSLHRRH
jgi:hypothetical protein